MELDVILTRSGDNPWGFRLIGGVDFNMPLTVVKVVPGSPADQAGLRNGDAVFSINGDNATTMMHDDSKKALASAGEILRLGVVRGLYDPVLDDYEPIYEPVDQDDFDQPSQPTEVPDHLDLTLTLPEFANAPNATNGLFKPLPDLVNGQKPDPRSLTASPFVLPTKPYRPFSTEPLPEIPPLEDPIILNPNFHEEFGRLKDEEEFLPKTRFKLPISEQYDPDGTKQKMKLEALKSKDVTTKDLVTATTESKLVKEETMVKKGFEMKEQAMTKQEVKFMKQMKKDIDLETIELTATSIVDDSIEKAVTVAAEIQKEIEVVLSESSDTETSTVKSVKESSKAAKSTTTASEFSSTAKEESTKLELKEQALKEVTELVDIIDKNTEEIVKQKQQKVEEKASHVDEVESVVDSKLSERKVSKTEKIVYDEVETFTDTKQSERKISKESQSLDQSERKLFIQESNAETVDIKDSQMSTSKAQNQTNTRDTRSETKYSTSKLLSEQRAYTIGLQTIPNIRGTVHSSCHYELLLKTFFIHLTDVMVALSRFILAEPILSKPSEQKTKIDTRERMETRQETVSKTEEMVSVDEKVKDIKATAKEDKVAREAVKHEATDAKSKEVSENAVTTAKIVPPAKKERVVGKIIQKAKEMKQQDIQQTSQVEEKKESMVHEQKRQAEIKYVDDNVRTEEIVKKRELSGSRMAQLVEKKPEELMQNMENVLTEFESKSTNEDIAVVRERRSRSRSAVATPVDMLMQQEISDQTFMTTSAMSSSMFESKTSKMPESGYETTDYETSDEAKTYIAIVQSHVYTNKDAIFDAVARKSIDEIVTKEAVESVSAEKVDAKTFVTSEKAVQAVVGTSTKMVSAEKEDTVQVLKKSEQAVVGTSTKMVSAEKEDTVQVLKKSEQAVVDTSTKMVSAEKGHTVQALKKSEQAVLSTSTKMVSAEKEDTVQVLKEVQKVEEKVKQEEIKSIEKTQDVIIQEITEPVVEEFKSTFKQDYTVTEAKEETENYKSEYISQHNEIKIEEISDVKDKKVSIKEEAKSIIEEEVAEIKDESSALKKEIVSLEQESISAAVTEIKKEEAIAMQEVLAMKSIKEESVAVKEKASIKEETMFVKEQVKNEATVAKDSVKEEVVCASFAKEEISAKQDGVEEFVSHKQESFVAKEVAVKAVDDSADLNISQEQVIEEKMIVEVEEQKDASLKKVEINEFESHSHIEQESTFVAKSIDQESTFVAKSIDQESTFIAKSLDQETKLVTKSVDKESTIVTKSVDTKENLKLVLDSEFDKKKIMKEIYEEGDLSHTPTPSTVPPTPLTDEYVFTLTTKLPKRAGPPIPRDCTPSDDEDEDPHIVKKGLVPIMEANIEDQKIFNPPLPSPPTSPKSPTSPTKSVGLKGGAPISTTSPKPVYFKPGLRGGAPTYTPVYIKPGLRGGAPMFPRLSNTPAYVKPGLRGGADKELSQEEIKEIERKSSLLASAIDETIKSIEEYKEEVGIKQAVTESSTEIKTKETVQNGVMYNGYAKVVETKLFDTALEEKFNHESKVIEQIKAPNEISAEVNGVKGEPKQVITNGISENAVQETEHKSQPESIQMNGSPIVSDETIMAVPVETSPEIEKPPTVIEKEVKIEKPQAVIENEIKAEEKQITEEKKHVVVVEEKRDPMEGYRPVHFDIEELSSQREKRAALGIKVPYLTPSQERELYRTPAGEIIGTHQGIVDGLEEPVVDPEVAKELGKPGITEEKIAELISGEAEMLREAHVMGLSRVLKSHMHRDDDNSSVDFNKIKPIVESLKDSEVLKALNEELLRDAEERKKKEAKKEQWTTFLQKPKRPVPKSKFGYYKDMEPEEEIVPAYRPKIVKQPKPKVAPDYKPKDFNTGLLPWEERALREPTPPPVEPEDPILIPEEAPEILEAVDPLPESEVPDLEDSGIPLPPQPEPKEATPPPEEPQDEGQEELDLDAVIEETEKIVEENLVEEMEGGNIAEQIMSSVQNMVDPNAPLDQQLAQMRAQLAALSQLPGVIQQSLEMVTRQLSMLSQMEAAQKPSVEEMPLPESDMTPAAVEETEVSENGTMTIQEIQTQEPEETKPVEPPAPTLTPEEIERMKKEEELMLEEQRRIEKQRKELMEQARLESESRQIKQRPTPRVGNPLPDPRVGTPEPNKRGKPQPVFGPAAPWERPVVLPGGRKWKTPKDAYNDAFIKETLLSQAELIAGKAMGVNFMKYEKPPVSLDHLKDSEVYKIVHNMDQTQPKRVEMLTPVIAEADYREKCRSMTPCPQRLAQQVQP